MIIFLGFNSMNTSGVMFGDHKTALALVRVCYFQLLQGFYLLIAVDLRCTVNLATGISMRRFFLLSGSLIS